MTCAYSPCGWSSKLKWLLMLLASESLLFSRSSTSVFYNAIPTGINCKLYFFFGELLLFKENGRCRRFRGASGLIRRLA